MAGSPVSLPPEAVAALHEGRAIEAMKIMRDAHGLQLKEVKEAVEAYLVSRPALRAKIAARQKKALAALGKGLLFIGIILAALIYFLSTLK